MLCCDLCSVQNSENKIMLVVTSCTRSVNPIVIANLVYDNSLSRDISIHLFIWRLWHKHRPPLWSSGQCSWLQIQRSGFDSRRYQIFWEVLGLEQGLLSLVSTTEELLEIKHCGSGLESREYGLSDPSRWPRGALYPQKTSSGRSVGIVRSRTQVTEIYGTNSEIGRPLWSRKPTYIPFKIR
jgi:hypothetical protein